MAKRIDTLDPKTVEQLNLKKIDQFEGAIRSWDSSDWSKFAKRCSFDNYFQEPFDSLMFNGDRHFYAGKNDSVVEVNGSQIYVHDHTLRDFFFQSGNQACHIAGVWFQEKNVVLLNGDIQFTNSEYDYNKQKYVGKPAWGSLHKALDKMTLEKTYPTISFLCLAQFYDNDLELVLKKFNSGELVLRDFEFDDTIPATKAVMEKIAAAKKKEIPAKISPPKLGYTLVNNKWHRPGAVLLWDSKNNWHILLGQDEGTYFGVELRGACNTINDAIDSLIPKEVQGQKYVRQGEWFIINVDPKSVPEEKDCVAICMDGAELPRETPDSNIHYVRANDIRFTKDGKFFANDPEVDHDQHASVAMKGWCTFYKNTALRSYSQEGVD